jgi:hypothetical protein
VLETSFAVCADKPDQFLWDLAAISSFNDRLTCFMFQFRFADSLADIENRLNIIRSVCEFLTGSENMKRMFAGRKVSGCILGAGGRGVAKIS